MTSSLINMYSTMSKWQAENVLLAILVVLSTGCSICSVDCLTVWFNYLRRQVLLRKGGSSRTKTQTELKLMVLCEKRRATNGYSSGHPMLGSLLSEVFFSLDLVNLVYNNNKN